MTEDPEERVRYYRSEWENACERAEGLAHFYKEAMETLAIRDAKLKSMSGSVAIWQMRAEVAEDQLEKIRRILAEES